MPPVQIKENIKRGFRITLVGVIINSFLAAVKIFTGIVGNSFALIADGIESTTDIFSSLIVFHGLRIAAEPPDEKHPYGHGKAEPIAAGIVAIFLIFAALFIFSEALFNLLGEKESPQPYTLAVLIVVVLLKYLLSRIALKVGKEIDSLAVRNDAKHHQADMLTSGAAFIGISISLIGGRGYENADDYAAIFAAIIILYNAIRLFKPSIEELMDATPKGALEKEIRKFAMEVEGVAGLDKCKIRKTGFDYYVDLDVIVDGEITVREGHRIAHKVKRKLRESIPAIANVLIHIEPNDERIDGRLKDSLENEIPQ
jgi:cation diffusion facilitator family transporter